MDVGLLEQIVRMMQANDLNMVDLREGTKRVVLKRGPATAEPVVVAAAAPTRAAKAPEEAAPAETENLIPIKSPMVGTFYAAPSPDAKAFVNVGTTVNEESDVCVIEAMKVFNNVKAECSGKIAKILVTNGQAVEFGQVLFLVKP
ncbi:MAG: acetyl-CoA carboxylase biotin carboxyl carrier protein [Tepidisphaeraceae bacterium]|jgi:acetyl-CoA carboxylase biotin carboxyl carrier protein